jgi:hypothetical protein
LSLTARWQDWSGQGVEHLVLTEGPDGATADAVLVAPAFAARYRLACDRGWRTRSLEVAVVGDDRVVRLAGDGAGGWTEATGAARPDLAGAIDVDLTATPFTNTLPIRRLGLRAGQAAEIRVVYVELPELTVRVDRQRYTCLEPGHRYRFDGLSSDFSREIEVDPRGLVVTYPGLFRRI